MDHSHKFSAFCYIRLGFFIYSDSHITSGLYSINILLVYKAYDSSGGSTVAWNEVHIKSLPPTEKKRVISEVKILERVEHHRIISFYGSWYDPKNHKVVFSLLQQQYFLY